MVPGGGSLWRSNSGEARGDLWELMVVVARGGSRVDVGSTGLQQKRVEVVAPRWWRPWQRWRGLQARGRVRRLYRCGSGVGRSKPSP
jgi:hypothetical protein